LRGLKGEEAEKIFETAHQKYEAALLTASDTTYLILYNWGNLLLEKVIHSYLFPFSTNNNREKN
jgi:hypothetical protein